MDTITATLRSMAGHDARTDCASREPFFSLVLATFGRTDELGRLFGSLAQQSFRAFETIVVDQNRDDRVCGHVTRAKAAGLDVSHIRLPEPNLSGARNRGIAVARGSFVGLPDDDGWYEADALQRLHDALTSSNGLDGAVARWVDVAPDAAGQATGELSAESWRRFRGGDASSITLFLRRDRVIAAGGFDVRIGVGRWYGAGEETDLLLRMLQSGARIARVPQACVRHRAPDRAVPLTWVGLKACRARERGVGAIYVKHRLAAWTIARGLVAPMFNGLRGRRRGARLAGMALGLATSIGRVEGALRWLVREPASAGASAASAGESATPERD